MDTVDTFGIYYQKRGTKFTDKEEASEDYSFGRYEWILSDPVQIKPRIPAKCSGCAGQTDHLRPRQIDTLLAGEDLRHSQI